MINHLQCVVALLFFSLFSLSSINAQTTIEPEYSFFSIDVDAIQQSSKYAPMIRSGLKRAEKPTVELPMPNGELQLFHVEEAPVFESKLAAQHPEIQSYVIQGVEDPTILGRFNVTPLGYYGIVRDQNGIGVIEPVNALDLAQGYQGYYETRSDFECSVSEHMPSDAVVGQEKTNSCFQNGATLRTFRMAVTVTHEYATLYGFTLSSVNAAIANRLAGINAVYENELAIHVELIAGNNALVNDILASSVSTDPFTNPNDFVNRNTTMNEGGAHIASFIALADYDFGHTFHEVTCPSICSVGGVAGLGVICREDLISGAPAKSRGFSPLIQNSSITLMLHELGHQFSCSHTNYGCGTNNQCSRYEPGRGSTIMSTSANCTGDDFFENRSDYFNVESLRSILDFMNNGDVGFGGAACAPTTNASWGTCAATSSSGNTPPSADANPNSGTYTIPGLTPFQLEGVGTDSDGDVLSYCWEQYDTDYTGSILPDNAGSAGTTTDPLFRSFPPTTNPVRVCPQLSSLLAGNTTTGTGEVLPDEDRTMNWRLIVRDNHAGAGGIACDEISITVDASSGPFEVTSQNTATTWNANGSNTTMITWSVNGTNMAPVSCANVDILFSTDGGNSFPYTLASNTPNDGSHMITIPSYPTSVGRIKIICSDNIFFDINDVDIEVTSSCIAFGSTFSPDTPVSANEGDASLNLNLTPAFGNLINSYTGNVSSSDPASNLAVDNGGSGTCINFSNATTYDEYTFEVSASGMYTFSLSGAPFGVIMTLYSGSFDPNNPCNNWLASSYVSGVGINSTVEDNLSAGLDYVLVVSVAPTATGTSLPANYTVTPSGPGNVYDGPPPPPSGSFDYTYVIVNVGTGMIVGIDMDSDLSNAATYPAGNYKVYGLSYDNTAMLGSYVGGSFSSLQNDLALLTICGNLSTNCLEVEIIGMSLCPPDYAAGNALTGTETGTAVYETDGAIESTQIIGATAIIDYDSATSIELNPGFETILGALFHAFIDGCTIVVVTGDDDDETNTAAKTTTSTTVEKEIKSEK